jgi:hypothetical protein
VSTDKEDPAVGKFLEFLDDDIQKHPERLQFLDERLPEED